MKVASALRDFGAGLENCFGCFLFLPVGFVFEALLWLIAVFSLPVWLIADFVSHGVLSISVWLIASCTFTFRFRSRVSVLVHSDWLSGSESEYSHSNATAIRAADMLA